MCGKSTEAMPAETGFIISFVMYNSLICFTRDNTRLGGGGGGGGGHTVQQHAF